MEDTNPDDLLVPVTCKPGFLNKTDTDTNSIYSVPIAVSYLLTGKGVRCTALRRPKFLLRSDGDSDRAPHRF
jgi:hypothetical protein